MKAAAGALILLALLAALAATPARASDVLVVAAEPAAEPWWRRARWSPRSVKVHGIAIKRLHPDWCAAEAFSRELFGEALLGPGGGSPLDGLSFLVEGNFDGSGKPQIAFVGAYRRCAGEQGLFFAIVEPQRERPRMRFLVEVPEPGSGFAAIGREPDGALAVWWCTQCDNGVRIEFSRAAQGFFVAGTAARR
jgi:hypothetical protein